MEISTENKEELSQINTQIVALQNELDTMKKSAKETRLSKMQLSFFLVLVLVVELAIAYFGYKFYYVSEEIYLFIAVAAIMATIFIYYLTFFIQGTWSTLFKNILVFFLAMAFLSAITILRFEISDANPNKSISAEYAHEKFASYEAKLEKLNTKNTELINYIKKQNEEHINELTINRKAIVAQQKAIKANARAIASGKKYQVIKNPF